MIKSKLVRAFVVSLSLLSLSVSPTSVFAAKQASASHTKISVNSANANVLSEVLSGVGLKKAQAIVAYREAHGKFKRLEDLTLVKGIGEATLEKNKAKLTL